MTTVTAEIRQLSDAELSALFGAGGIDVPTLEAECARREQADKAKRDRADRAAARRALEQATWYEDAYAQYEASLDFTKGNMFSRFYLQEQESRNARLAAQGKPPAPESDGMVLWKGDEDWAQKRASWELQRFWQDNGGRLSLARYRREQAMAARADRDARDLARMAAKPAPSARDLAEQAARAPRPVAAPVARPAGGIARMITALGLLERQANRTRASLARVNGGVPA